MSGYELHLSKAKELLKKVCGTDFKKIVTEEK